MKIFSTFSLLLTGVFLFSCQKDTGNTPAKTDQISASAWMYESGGIDGDKNGTIDLAFTPGTLEPCRIDNILTFTKSGTGISDEGATKCSPSDPQQVPFNWAFADAETSLVINGNVYPLLNGKFKIQTLTATRFSLSKDTLFSGQNVSVIVNLKH